MSTAATGITTAAPTFIQPRQESRPIAHSVVRSQVARNRPADIGATNHNQLTSRYSINNSQMAIIKLKNNPTTAATIPLRKTIDASCPHANDVNVRWSETTNGGRFA